jgi:hypothetical protein
MSVVQKMLQEISWVNDGIFSFKWFEAMLQTTEFDAKQTSMLDQRMDLLRSFCAQPTMELLKFRIKKLKENPPPAGNRNNKNQNQNKTPKKGQWEVPKGLSAEERKKQAKSYEGKRDAIPSNNILHLEPGTLTIVDLSDPFVDAATVCILFQICLSIFSSTPPDHGLVVALDEAHKYLTKSAAAEDFVEAILTTIRLQRHKAARIIVATQEPTISDKLLDLCSISIVHRFNSPAWFAAIREHLGGASTMTATDEQRNEIFRNIVGLEAGESLVFSPSAFVKLRGDVPEKLGTGYMKMKTRLRITRDTGGSEMSNA